MHVSLENHLTSEKMASKARVVVTGLGAVSPLGVGVQESWSKLCRFVDLRQKASECTFEGARVLV